MVQVINQQITDQGTRKSKQAISNRHEIFIEKCSKLRMGSHGLRAITLQPFNRELVVVVERILLCKYVYLHV